LNRIMFIVIVALLLAGCNSKATPMVDSALALATENTLPAKTQSATPALPTLTHTPSPSPTIIPTLVELLSTPDVDPCDGPLFANSVGASDAGKINNGASVFIKNSTRAPITVSLYLSMNKFGKCGSVSYSLAPGQSVSVVNVLPYGCYYASAYVNDPKKPSRPSGDSACITGPDRTTFTVFADRIKITGP